jgi:hypothetical protein
MVLILSIAPNACTLFLLMKAQSRVFALPVLIAAMNASQEGYPHSKHSV